MSRRDERTERNAAIYEHRQQGESYRAIAERFGLSIIRIRQIIDAEDRKKGVQDV